MPPSLSDASSISSNQTQQQPDSPQPNMDMYNNSVSMTAAHMNAMPFLPSQLGQVPPQQVLGQQQDMYQQQQIAQQHLLQMQYQAAAAYQAALYQATMAQSQYGFFPPQIFQHQQMFQPQPQPQHHCMCQMHMMMRGGMPPFF